MTDENIYQIFENNFRNCLERETGRKNLFLRCIRALANAKSDKTKLLILFGKIILDENFKYNKELILGNENITNSVIKVINEAWSINLDDECFKDKLFNLSKIIDFFYKISKLYTDLFSNETKLCEIFTSLLFERKYNEDINDYINSFRILVTNNKIEKLKYEELLSYVEKNYDKNNNFKDEYIKLFLQNNPSYIDKLNSLSRNSQECNKSKLEKILLKNTETNKKDLNKNNILINHNIENESSQFNINIDNSEDKNINNIKIIKENIITISDKSEINGQNENENNNKNDIKIKLDKIKEKSENNISTLSNINEIKNIENNNIDNNNSKENVINETENNSNEIYSIKVEDTKANNQNKTIINNNENKSDEKEESTGTTNKILKDNLRTVKDYLNEKFNEYTTNKFKPLCLKYILEHNICFDKFDISYVRLLNRYKIEFNASKKLNDKILEDLLGILELTNSIPDTQKYGYFCYDNNKKEKVEALYSIIDSSVLYDDITRVNEAEDFCEINDNIRKDYLKSRAKSLEYFINKSVFEKKYGNKSFPRIIFPLQRVRNNGEYNDNSYENEIEIDGCFFVQKQFNLDNNEFPFESQYFNHYIYNYYYGINYKKAYEFLPNDFCLIEIKTHFPPNGNIKQKLYDSSYEKDFEQIIIEFLDKMRVFEQLIRDMNLKYERIRLIIFYDVVKKKNYQDKIKNILNKYKLKEKCKNYYKKIYIQIFYMNANYFAASLKRFEDTIDIVNTKYEELKQNLESEKERNRELNGKYEELNKKYDEVKKNLEELIKIFSEKMDEETKKKIEERVEKNKSK